MELYPPVGQTMEEDICKQFRDAGIIVSRMQTPDSPITDLLNKLGQNQSDLEKEELREKLKYEISTALKAGGILPKVIPTFIMVHVTLLISGIELSHAKCGKSIVLYLRCLTLESLLWVREMILSGLLLNLVSEVIKQFIPSESRVQLVVSAEDYNTCVACFNSTSGKFEFFACVTVIICTKYELGHNPIFSRRGRPSPIIFCTASWANKCLETLPLTVFTQTNFAADFRQAKCDYRRK